MTAEIFNKEGFPKGAIWEWSGDIKQALTKVLEHTYNEIQEYNSNWEAPEAKDINKLPEILKLLEQFEVDSVEELPSSQTEFVNLVKEQNKPRSSFQPLLENLTSWVKLIPDAMNEVAVGGKKKIPQKIALRVKKGQHIIEPLITNEGEHIYALIPLLQWPIAGRKFWGEEGTDHGPCSTVDYEYKTKDGTPNGGQSWLKPGGTCKSCFRQVKTTEYGLKCHMNKYHMMVIVGDSQIVIGQYEFSGMPMVSLFSTRNEKPSQWPIYRRGEKLLGVSLFHLKDKRVMKQGEDKTAEVGDHFDIDELFGTSSNEFGIISYIQTLILQYRNNVAALRKAQFEERTKLERHSLPQPVKLDDNDNVVEDDNLENDDII